MAINSAASATTKVITASVIDARNENIVVNLLVSEGIAMAFSRRAAFAAAVMIEWVSVNKATSETAFWQAERALLFVANQAAQAATSAALTAVKGLFTLS